MKVKFNIRPDIPNKNGVIFPKEVLEEAFNKYKAENYRFGALKYSPSGSMLSVSDVAFEVKSIEQEGDLYVGEIEILNSPTGKQLQEKIAGKPLEDFRLCTMMIGDTDIVKEDVIRVKNAKVEYVTIFPREECA